MKRNQLTIIIFSIFLLKCVDGYSQINLSDAQFFHNKYLANPAMAGNKVGFRANIGYRNQWSGVPGAPIDQNFTLDHRSRRVGTGLSVLNSKAGDLSHTKVYGTYSYGIRIDEESSELRFGINFGFQRTSFDVQNVVGDRNDRNIINFNDRKTIVDGDFGVAYTTDRFSLEGVVYNLKNQISEDGSDLDIGTDFNLFYAAAGYMIPISDWKVNAILGYRNVKNFDDIVDVGAELKTFNENIAFTGMYHTNKSSTFGISYLHKQQWRLTSLYNTAANPIATYANGTFEVALELNLENIFKK